MEKKNEHQSIRYIGNVDSYVSDNNFISGWALDIQMIEVPQFIEVYADSICIGSTIADKYRDDLFKEIGSKGYHGFCFPCPSELCNNTIHEFQVKIIDTGIYLPQLAKSVFVPYPFHILEIIQKLEYKLEKSYKGYLEIEQLLQGIIP